MLNYFKVKEEDPFLFYDADHLHMKPLSFENDFLKSNYCSLEQTQCYHTQVFFLNLKLRFFQI